MSTDRLKKHTCPICCSESCVIESYYDEFYLAEEYIFCPDCGYRSSMSYGPVLEYFDDKTRYYFPEHENIKNNIEMHEKVRSKISGIDHIPVDPEWADYI